jgi:hypothetical protein
MDKDINEQVNDLLDFAPPRSLRQSLNLVFFNYLWHNHQALPANFDKIAEDFYFLLDFLEKVDVKTETNSP